MSKTELDSDAVELAEAAEDEVELLSLFGGYKEDGTASKGDALQIVRDHLADAEQWHGKTDVSYHQTQPLAAGHNLAGFYRALGFEEEAEMIDEFMPDYLTDFEILLTSAKDSKEEENARDQAERIIESIFGDTPEVTEATKGLARRLLSGPDDDDE